MKYMISGLGLGMLMAMSASSLYAAEYTCTALINQIPPIKMNMSNISNRYMIETVTPGQNIPVGKIIDCSHYGQLTVYFGLHPGMSKSIKYNDQYYYQLPDHMYSGSKDYGVYIAAVLFWVVYEVNFTRF